MKKVTFILDKLVMGGTEQAFLRLVKYIDREKFDINLILLRQGGELEQFLPDYVKVEYAKTRLLKDSLKHFRILEFFWGIYCRIRIRNAKNDFEDSLYNYKVRTLPESLNAESIICFFSSGFLCKMMTAYSKSNRKIFWVHSIIKETYRDNQYLNIMNHFDYICCASLAMKEDFCRRFPMLADKTMVIYNIIDENNIRQKAEEVISEKLESVSLMTVGRLSEEKGQLIIPAVTRKLLDRDYIVYWYLIGGG